MRIGKDIKGIARTFGLDFPGIADLKPARDFIRAQGGDDVMGFPAAVSIGIVLPDAIVDMLPRRHERAVRVNYRCHAYHVINLRLDPAASSIASHLQRGGHAALPVPAAKRVDDERVCASFSPKLAARFAGFGWIGKSCLLVTPVHGPRVRWATVLTGVPLAPSGKPVKDRCGDCTACVDVCPAGAFTGKPFLKGEPRESRYDVKKCEKYFDSLKENGQEGVCGMCLYICPYGKKSDK